MKRKRNFHAAKGHEKLQSQAAASARLKCIPSDGARADQKPDERICDEARGLPASNLEEFPGSFYGFKKYDITSSEHKMINDAFDSDDSHSDPDFEGFTSDESANGDLVDYNVDDDIISNQNVDDKYWSAELERYQCDKCSKTYSFRIDILNHLNECTEVSSVIVKYNRDDDKYWNSELGRYKCDKCGKTVNYRKGIISHLKYCVFFKIETLEQYWNTVSLRFECDNCPESFETTKKLSSHLRSHVKAQKRNEIRRRMRKEEDPIKSYWNEATGLYECNECDMKSGNRPQMSFHLTKHGKLFRRVNQPLEDDPFKQYWNIKKAVYECDECAKTYVLPNYFAQHLKSQCSQSNKKPLVKALWNETTKQFECNKCDKTFAHGLLILMHLKHHAYDPDQLKQYWNNQKFRYECDKCDTTCQIAIAMNMHMKKHDNINKREDQINSLLNKETGLYECNECNDQFSQAQFLSIHMVLHGKRFRISTQADRDANPLKPYWSEASSRYECDQCKQVYRNLKVMAKHLSAHHAVASTGQKKTSHKKKATTNNHASSQPYEDSSDHGPTLPRRPLKDTPSTDDPLWPYYNSTSDQFECDQCDKICPKRSQLLDHLKFHEQVNMQYKQPDSLNNYWNDETERFGCDQCPHTFEKRAEIKTHFKRHARCNKFQTKALRALNKQNPEDDNQVITNDLIDSCEQELLQLWNATLGKFQCNQCDRTFALPDSIRKHLRGHDLIRRDVESFWKQLEKGNQKSVNMRLLIDPIKYMYLSKYWNEEQSRYECDQCAKTYTSRRPMAKHLTVHTGCDLRLLEEDEDSDTEDSSNNDESLTENEALSTFFINCRVCDLGFDDLTDLQLHMDTAHPTTLDEILIVDSFKPF